MSDVIEKDSIRFYETCLFSKEFCRKEDNLRRIIHEDYMEYGASGKIYHREDEWQYLLHLDADRPIEIMDFHREYIKEDVILVHYRSKHLDKQKEALRTSVWVKTDEGWKIRFHQGTWIQHNDYEES